MFSASLSKRAETQRSVLCAKASLNREHPWTRDASVSRVRSNVGQIPVSIPVAVSYPQTPGFLGTHVSCDRS
jgi:hypothetical protein